MSCLFARSAGNLERRHTGQLLQDRPRHDGVPDRPILPAASIAWKSNDDRVRVVGVQQFQRFGESGLVLSRSARRAPCWSCWRSFDLVGKTTGAVVGDPESFPASIFSWSRVDFAMAMGLFSALRSSLETLQRDLDVALVVIRAGTGMIPFADPLTGSGQRPGSADPARSLGHLTATVDGVNRRSSEMSDASSPRIRVEPLAAVTVPCTAAGEPPHEASAVRPRSSVTAASAARSVDRSSPRLLRGPLPIRDAGDEVRPVRGRGDGCWRWRGCLRSMNGSPRRSARTPNLAAFGDYNRTSVLLMLAPLNRSTISALGAESDPRACAHLQSPSAIHFPIAWEARAARSCNQG